MIITILGASGFIGSALAHHFEEKGHEVTRLVQPGFDLSLPATFERIPIDTDILIHAAGYVGNEPQEAMLWKVNVESTYYLIKHLNSSCHLKLLIYLSSGAIYGYSVKPFTLDSPLRPVGLYGVSKLLSEHLLETLPKFPVTRLRLFFPFGPGQRPPRFIPTLIKRIARGEAIEIDTESGFPMVNPIFINSLISQITHILFAPECTTYNLGGAEIYSVRGIAELIAKTLGVQVFFTIKNESPGNVVCIPDLSCPNKETFEEQLARTIWSADYL